MKDELSKEFIQASKNIERILLRMLFEPYSFVEKGLAYYIRYKRENTVVEFIFGPPEFQIEMLIYISGREYAFRDLLQIPAIARWVNSNRYSQKVGRNIENEMLWFVELLKISLLIIK